MKKFLAVCGAFLTAGMLTVPAYSADSSCYYVSGDVGASWFNSLTPSNSNGTLSTNAGINVMGAVGIKPSDSYRLEVELGYQRNTADQMTGQTDVTYNGKYTGNVSVTSVLANGYYDFNAGSVSPYLTAGIGWASVGVNDINQEGDPASWATSESHSALGYQFGAGVGIPLSKNVDIDVRYRYFRTGNFSMNNNGGDYHVASNSVLVGLKLGF